MVSRSGSLLERNVSKIFELTGFKPELNKLINGYEIDVYVKYKTIDLVIECKQYEKSPLTLRNLIHQWDSKNKEIQATKVLLVVVGINISEKDMVLAKKFKITIWDENKLEELLNEAIHNGAKIKNKVLIEAGLKSTKEINEEIKIVCNKYECTKEKAVLFLKGKLSDNDLRLLRNIEMDATHNARLDMLSLLKRDWYYDIPSKSIYNIMVKYKIPDKNLARLFVNERGGVFKGESFSKTKIRKMKMLMDELGYSYTELNNKEVDKLTITKVKQIIKLMKENNNITYNSAKYKVLNDEDRNKRKENIKNGNQPNVLNQNNKTVEKVFIIIGTIILIVILLIILPSEVKFWIFVSIVVIYSILRKFI